MTATRCQVRCHHRTIRAGRRGSTPAPTSTTSTWLPGGTDAPHARTRAPHGSRISATSGALNPLRPDADDDYETAPKLLVEVLSPDTAAKDDGEKRVNCQTLGSLVEYLLPPPHPRPFSP